MIPAYMKIMSTNYYKILSNKLLRCNELRNVNLENAKFKPDQSLKAYIHPYYLGDHSIAKKGE